VELEENLAKQHHHHQLLLAEAAEEDASEAMAKELHRENSMEKKPTPKSLLERLLAQARQPVAAKSSI